MSSIRSLFTSGTNACKKESMKVPLSFMISAKLKETLEREAKKENRLKEMIALFKKKLAHYPSVAIDEMGNI